MVTPESESSLPSRRPIIATTPENIVGSGEAAKAFTAETLSAGPFTVWTRWADALGRSKPPRFYAFIQVGNKDLGEMIVTAGLARIYGTRVPMPDGGTSRNYLEKLETMETEAKAAGRGA